MQEGAHASLDIYLYGSRVWVDAVAADNKFASDYAKNQPWRDDISETYLVWFATRYSEFKFTEEALADWRCYMSNRFTVFEDISCKPGMMYPWPDCVPLAYP